MQLPMPGLSLQVPHGPWDRLPAHLSSLAHRIYWAMLSQRKDQSMVALGRNGTWKMACCEELLEQLLALAGSVDGTMSGSMLHQQNGGEGFCGSWAPPGTTCACCGCDHPSIRYGYDASVPARASSLHSLRASEAPV